MTSRFGVEVLVDFVDDAIVAKVPIRPEHLDSYIAHLHDLGVHRVNWIYYGEARDGWLTPDESFEDDGSKIRIHNYRATIRLLGNPLRAAVQACRKYGMEVWACYKPYEQGISMAIPAGCPHARRLGLLPSLTGPLVALAPFVAANPHLRVKRRGGDIPADVQNIPIHSIRLIKADDAPTRITADHLQIWASDHNWEYQRLDVPFTLTTSIETCPSEIRDVHDNLVTRKGDSRRVLTLAGLDLRQKYILITTDFSDGPADFQNAGTHILEAVGPDGTAIPGVYANEFSLIYQAFSRDFRRQGLAFDNGWGDASIQLDKSNADGHTGIIAYCRGREPYLPAGLCETCPEVRDHWLSELADMLDAGVDGVDFRVENHCMHTDFPQDYGFNDQILAQCDDASGTDLESQIAKIRGAAYTDFLTRAKAMIASRGKKMRVHLNVDLFRPVTQRPRGRALAMPAHLDFEWRQWINAGLLDEATLRTFHLPFSAVFDDSIAAEMIELCNQRRIPVIVQRNTYHVSPENTYASQFQRVRADDRFAGFQIYEAQSFLQLDGEGQWVWVEHNGMKNSIDELRPFIAQTR